MAFVVEDNTGLSNANSYVSEAYADTYFSERGITAWEMFSSATKQSLLIKGSDYIEAVYYGAWIYEPLNDTQSLSWARVDDSGVTQNVPDRLKKAVCELALKANSETLLEDVSQRTTEETVGAITVKYAEYANQQTQYSNVYALVKPYLISGSSVNMATARV